MLYNYDLIILFSSLSIFGVFIYTFYDNIFTPVTRPSNTNVGPFNFIKQALIRLSFCGTVSTHVKTTEVTLGDEELTSLLEVLFREVGSATEITVGHLASLGLYTSTVIEYLQGLGYIIIF
jgi:hypothetical protein